MESLFPLFFIALFAEVIIIIFCYTASLYFRLLLFMITKRKQYTFRTLLRSCVLHANGSTLPCACVRVNYLSAPALVGRGKFRGVSFFSGENRMPSVLSVLITYPT